MKTKPSSRFSSAFTLTELLVTLLLLGMVASLCVASVSTAGDQSARAVCSGNLKQFSRAWLMYAADNAERFPAAANGAWPWDLPAAAKNTLTNYSMRWQTMFCPGTASRFTEADNLSLYNYSPNFGVVGYALTLPGSATLHVTNQNSTALPQRFVFGGVTLAPVPLQQRVLMADATISGVGQANESQRHLYNYTSIAAGFAKPHMSAHLAGNLPEGGNVAMLDGHVEWRRFALMRVRASGMSPTFWW